MCLKKPKILSVTEGGYKEMHLEVSGGIEDEEMTQGDSTSSSSISVTYKAVLYKDNEAEGKEVPLTTKKAEGMKNVLSLKSKSLEPNTAYTVKVKAVYNGEESKWSDAFEFTTPTFSGLVWKECPDHVSKGSRYSLDENNPRIATKIDDYGSYCTIIGNTPIPLNKVTSWNVKILKSQLNTIYIGVAPSDINQNDYNYDKCGWYFNCYGSKLCSGPPHSYRGKEYGQRKGEGRYVHTGGSVGAMMDTTKGELSFILNSICLDVAYEGVPLDKPLVPCVILNYEGDSVELDTKKLDQEIITF